MTTPPLHPWTLDPDKAIRLQESLRERLVLAWDGRPVNTIGGVDVSYSDEIVRAAIAVLHYPDLTPRVAVTAEAPLVFPYLPGLLAFRIGPAILTAWEKLSEKPDVLLIHGHGIAHPRGFGLASHLGLWLETPTIGVARSRLYGNHEEIGVLRGNWSKLWDARDPSQTIGAVLRTRENTRPIYISPGHLIDLMHAVELVLACCHGHRLPETLRMAYQVLSGAQLPVTLGAS